MAPVYCSYSLNVGRFIALCSLIVERIEAITAIGLILIIQSANLYL